MGCYPFGLVCIALPLNYSFFRAYFALITTCPRCLLVFYYYTLFRLFCPLLFFLFKNYSR